MMQGGLGGAGGSGVRARPGGGFNQGMGQFGEHLDESAFQSNVTQKMLGQQQANPMTASAAAQGAAAKSAASQGQQRPPRAVGSLADELIKRPIDDLWHEVKQFFSLNNWLGINPNTEDPQQKQKRRSMMQRFNKLTEEQQSVAKQKYQEDMKKKEMAKQEEERKKQQEAQKQKQTMQMPSSPKKGPVGPASGKSKKSNMMAQLQQQRTTMSQAQGAN